MPAAQKYEESHLIPSPIIKFWEQDDHDQAPVSVILTSDFLTTGQDYGEQSSTPGKVISVTWDSYLVMKSQVVWQQNH